MRKKTVISYRAKRVSSRWTKRAMKCRLESSYQWRMINRYINIFDNTVYGNCDKRVSSRSLRMIYLGHVTDDREWWSQYWRERGLPLFRSIFFESSYACWHCNSAWAWKVGTKRIPVYVCIVLRHFLKAFSSPCVKEEEEEKYFWCEVYL